jgi:filamentous hemagglutinin family protein
MNRIYRLVWSRVRNAWVAVSELAPSQGKGRKSLLRMGTVAGALTLAFGSSAYALPVGGSVTSGTASISSGASTMTVNQASQNASINWQSFNIGSTETVNFVQPSSTSIAVNRIVGADGSQIYGHLNANGQVWLINPNGVLFGKDAQVNVGGLVASTLDVNDASVGNGSVSFSGSGTGSVINQGTLNAANGGYVALVGNHVGNQGTITAQLGAVALAAGSAATLTFSGNNLVHVQVDQSTLNNLAENGGLMQADGGMVVMTAGAKDAVLASVVNNSGVIEARTVANHGGTITLLGGMSAGQVNVDGTLDASAPNGGNGGNIETSAASVTVANSANVTTAAPQGLTGTWLIDPADFTIAPSGGDMTGAQLAKELSSTDVTLSSSQGTSGTSGNVNVNDTVTWIKNTLTLNAGNDIDINGKLTLSNKAALVLSAGNNINVNAPMAASGTATLSFTATNDVNVNAVMTAVGTASLDFEPGSGNLNMALGPDGFTGRVDICIRCPLTIDGNQYIVINSLGSSNTLLSNNLQGIENNLSGYYALGGNIDASTTSTWKSGAGFLPLGDNNNASGNSFSGVFDGLGHTIKNLTINRPNANYVGLFGYGSSGAIIRNVGLIGASIKGNNYVGGLVGFSYANVRNSYVTGSVAGADYVGGLVGANGNRISLAGGPVGNSFSAAAVAGSNYVGGLAGYNNGGMINLSFATGNVSGSGKSVGGLVGYNYGGDISSSYATGSVTGGNYVGGLVGRNYGGIVDSYATGSASGGNYVGGLVGANGFGGSIGNSYSTGSVTGSNYVGGLAGADAGDVTASFWNTDTSGQATSAAGTGVNSAQMMTMSTYADAGWNIADTGGSGAAWRIYNGFTMPLITSLLMPLALPNTIVNYNGLLQTGATAAGVSASIIASGTNVGTYDPSYYSGQQGYDISGGTLTINPAVLTVTGLSSTSRAYNGSTLDVLSGTAVLNGLVNGETLTLGNATTGILSGANAGSQSVATALTISDGTGLASNYILVQPTLSNVTISQVPLTVTGLSSTSRAYNGSALDVLSGTAVLNGLVNGETLTLGNATTGILSSANAGSQSVATALTISDGTGLASNYTLIQPTLSNVTINQAPLSVAGIVAASSKTYDGTTAATLTGGTLSGTLYDSVTLVQSGTFSQSNAGNGLTVTAADTLSGAAASNYVLTQPAVSGTANINPAPLTVTGISGTSRAYNGSALDVLSGTAVLNGLVNGETLTLGNATTGILSGANAGSQSVTTAITLSDGTGLASNYTLTQPTLPNVTISQAPLTVTGLSSTSRPYNGSNVDALTGTAVLNGLVNGETLVLGNATAGILSSANAGNQSVTTAITLSDGTGLASNYALTQPTLPNVTISPVTLSVTVGNQTKIFGNPDPALTYTVMGLMPGDTLSGALARAPGTADGTYKITQGTLSAGPSYNLVFVPGTLTILPLVLPDIQPAPVFMPADQAQPASSPKAGRTVAVRMPELPILTLALPENDLSDSRGLVKVLDGGVRLPDDMLSP